MSNRLDRRRLDRRRLGWRRLLPVLLLLVSAAVVVAGCEGYVEGGGAGKAPAGRSPSTEIGNNLPVADQRRYFVTDRLTGVHLRLTRR